MTAIELLPLRDLQSCCAPITRDVVSEENAASLARALKALADPARLRIVSMIAAHEDGEACVCDLTDPLGLLAADGVTSPEGAHRGRLPHEVEAGTWAYYRIAPGSLDADVVVHLRGLTRRP